METNEVVWVVTTGGEFFDEPGVLGVYNTLARAHAAVELEKLDWTDPDDPQWVENHMWFEVTKYQVE